MSKGRTTALVWGITLLLVILMLGAAVYIVQNQKAVTRSSYTAPRTDAPPPEPIVQTSRTAPQEHDPVYVPQPAPSMQGERTPRLEPQVAVPQAPQILKEKSEAEINRLAAEKLAEKLRQDAELNLSDIAGQMSVDMKLVGFKKNKFMLRYTCYRHNISPPLSWSNAPAGARSFVVMMDRVDEGESPVPYWILFNIPAETTSLPEKVPSPQSGSMRYGANNFDKPEYAGPCDPQDKHTYRIRVFALDTALGEPVGVSRANMVRAMDGHILDVGELTALHYMQ